MTCQGARASTIALEMMLAIELDGQWSRHMGSKMLSYLVLRQPGKIMSTHDDHSIQLNHIYDSAKEHAVRKDTQI